jgi:FkbM family methyltransferase
MSFISYSQNTEDVLLWRALKDVPAGFYIDVGANDPVEHSVTKAFYDAGWRGINIEPMPSYLDVFLRERPRDINLAVACGAEEGSITLFDTPSVNGWASTDAATAAAHRAEGVDVIEVQVPLRTLSGICAEHVDGPIHFLKIDVEGFEGEVLRGMDLRAWRPWILVIEATLPNSRATNHASWEHLVTSCDYQFAYFDGLNRYYVAAEHAALREVLAVQANVFDEFISSHLDAAWRNVEGQQRALERAHRAHQDAQQAHQTAQAAEQLAHQAFVRCRGALDRSQQQAAEAEERALEQDRQLAALRLRLVQIEAELGATAHWAGGLEQQLLAILGSRAWRWTRVLRLLLDGGLGARLRRLTATRRRRAVNWLASRQLLRRLLLPLLGRAPWLRGRVSGWLSQARAQPLPSDDSVPALPARVAALPQSARQVLADLQRGAPSSDH